jgi:hypothetical protein
MKSGEVAVVGLHVVGDRRGESSTVSLRVATSKEATVVFRGRVFGQEDRFTGKIDPRDMDFFRYPERLAWLVRDGVHLVALGSRSQSTVEPLLISHKDATSPEVTEELVVQFTDDLLADALPTRPIDPKSAFPDSTIF